MQGKTNNILEKRQMDKLKNDLELARREKSMALRRVNSLEMECQDLQAALEEADAGTYEVDEIDLTEAGDNFEIRDGGRGRPVAENFVQHVRCLMATGSSARSCREQLLLSAMYFVKDTDAQEAFLNEVPGIPWFNKQREALANEAYLYSMTRLAKCEAVEQWGFDESGLDGIPSLNQWCRIREGEAYVTITMECGGLLPGSSSEQITEHIKKTWQRGQEAITILRRELGDEGDTYVPLVNGGISLSKLRGVMHDTCNAANKVARLMRLERDESGVAMFGEEEWGQRAEYEAGWQDFLCGNHSRNLPVDAFNRR
jgi:hypothetical protein